MTFDEARAYVVKGTREDWQVQKCGGSGPSYRDRLTSVDQDGKAVVCADSHHAVAVYKPDLGLSIAWGLTRSKHFDEPWAKNFPDKKPSSAFFDLFYCGALVWRTIYVVVDGGRGYLPLPSASDREGIPTVSPDDDQLIRLLSDLEGLSEEYDRCFRRAGLRVMKSQSIN